jgi:hypothetical protein
MAALVTNTTAYRQAKPLNLSCQPVRMCPCAPPRTYLLTGSLRAQLLASTSALNTSNRMPLLYVIGLVWLVVIELADRHALTRLCRRPVRYGPRLPYLLLGAGGDPDASTTHCCMRRSSGFQVPSSRVWLNHFYNCSACTPRQSGPTPELRGSSLTHMCTRTHLQTCCPGRQRATARLGCGCTPTLQPRAAICHRWSALTAPARSWHTWHAGEAREKETCPLKMVRS